MPVKLICLPEVEPRSPLPGEGYDEFLRLWAAKGRYARISPHIMGIPKQLQEGQAIRPVLCLFGKEMGHAESLAALAKQGLRPCRLGAELLTVGSLADQFLKATKLPSLVAVAAGGPHPSVSGYPQVGTIFCHPSERSLGTMNRTAVIRPEMWLIGIRA